MNQTHTTKKLEDKTDRRNFRRYFAVFIAAIIIICFLPLLLTNAPGYLNLDFRGKGTIGDTIGGIMGPFVGIVASAVTFLAFWQQYRANSILQSELIEQKAQYEEDKKANSKKDKLDRFENRYYEMLRFHRANMEEMKIGHITGGRKCFVEMYNEFRFCFDVSQKYNKLLNKKTQLEPENLTAFAYKIFFYGIGDTSNKQHNFDKPESKLFASVNEKLKEVKSDYYQVSTGNTHTKIVHDKIVRIGRDEINYHAEYLPFDGHVSRLAHYYRHLFHTVKFVVKQEESHIPFETKLEYLQMLRAQLSNHEQAMLYYNAIAGFSQAWFKNEFFTKYKMIHNLPFALADFGVLPHEHEEIKIGIEFWEKRGGQLFEQDED